MGKKGGKRRASSRRPGEPEVPEPAAAPLRAAGEGTSSDGDGDAGGDDGATAIPIPSRPASLAGLVSMAEPSERESQNNGPADGISSSKAAIDGDSLDGGEELRAAGGDAAASGQEPERPSSQVPLQCSPLDGSGPLRETAALEGERHAGAEASDSNPRLPLGKEELSAAAARDAFQQELAGERRSNDALRQQLKRLEDLAALRDSDEAGTQAELVQLREANARLENEVAQLREAVEQAEGERRHVAARLAAAQTGMQQLECEASVRSRAQNDFSAATSSESKGWLGWGGNGPALAEAAALVEDSRVQKAAAAAVVDKLLQENAKLADQLNEQSALLDRLAQRYSALVHQQDDAQKLLHVPCVPMTNEHSGSDICDGRAGNVCGPGQAVQHAADLSGGQPDLEELVVSVGRYDADTLLQYARTVPLPLSTPTTPSHPANTGAGVEPAAFLQGPRFSSRNGVFDSTEKQQVLGAMEESSPVAKVEARAAVALADAPLIGAPIRLVAFIGRFVSGADLVR
eukprot:SM000113S24028  [mRNA]  locus=s113:603:3082:+ [translate_table: standard]